MFRAERAIGRGAGTLERIAIVDDEPESQYLYPEFLLARQAFLRAGIDAVVADAARLRFENGRLWAGEAAIDLVYNRLVDFSLERPEHAAMREAYVAGAVVVTPNPRNHALLADKRNLTLLSDGESLSSLGLPPELAQHSARIPRTVRVSPDGAPELWERRKILFFKPAAGHGAKAVYRGDKLTRGVWRQIVGGEYVAQDLISPGERMIRQGDTSEPRKMDIRLFAYDEHVLLAAAQLYRAATNSRHSETARRYCSICETGRGGLERRLVKPSLTACVRACSTRLAPTRSRPCSPRTAPMGIDGPSTSSRSTGLAAGTSRRPSGSQRHPLEPRRRRLLRRRHHGDLAPGAGSATASPPRQLPATLPMRRSTYHQRLAFCRPLLRLDRAARLQPQGRRRTLCFSRRRGRHASCSSAGPGRDKDLQGRPLRRRAGQLFDKISGIGLAEADVHITNIVYWRPPGNRTPTPQEAQVCRPFLERQVELVAPQMVVLLGGAAAKHILDVPEGIMRLRGKFRDVVIGSLSVRAMATLHPAYLLRTPAAKRLAWRDLLAIKGALEA